MYWLNKIVWLCFTPTIVGLLLFVGGLTLTWFKRAQTGCLLTVIGVFWLWVWSANVLFYFQQEKLVIDFPPQLAENLPTADAIVVLGGGMGINTNLHGYADLSSGGDRAWHAARLWKAGRAPIIITSGYDTEFTDTSLMCDLGVDRKAIVNESKSRNTEENAKFIAQYLGEGKSVLLVTSVWHMKRSLLMFEKFAPAVKVIPAPADYEGRGKGCFGWMNLYPSSGNFSTNDNLFHELVGYYWYKWFR